MGSAGGEENGEQEDELDRLLDQYEAQAAAELQRVQRAEAAARPAKKMTDTERREAALHQPLAADNK